MSLMPLGLLSQGGGASADFELISTVYGTGSSGTISFSSIPTVYKHLQIRYTSINDVGSGDWLGQNIRLNGDTASNYVSHGLEGNGSTVSSYYVPATTSALAGESSKLANIPGVGIIDILDAFSTNKNKTIRTFDGIARSTSPYKVAMYSGVWLSTAAVSSISLFIASNNFTTASRFSLYGVRG